MVEEKIKATDHGEVFFSWQFPEFVQYDRGRGWYLTAGLISLALIIWSVWTANFLFALGLIIIALIVALHENRDPLTVNFEINEDGIKLADKFFEYKEIKDFFIIYEPPAVKDLHFEFDSYLRPRLAIPLQDNDPVEVRAVLLRQLPENLSRQDEPLSDYLARKWKL